MDDENRYCKKNQQKEWYLDLIFWNPITIHLEGETWMGGLHYKGTKNQFRARGISDSMEHQQH